MPLVSIDKLFKSLSGLIFEYCEIARAMPIEIPKTEVYIDLHIYAILDVHLLIRCSLKNSNLKGALMRS